MNQGPKKGVVQKAFKRREYWTNKPVQSKYVFPVYTPLRLPSLKGALP
jgi:hypothetical protein